ncbi:hypothetical protein J3R74_002984 [Puniceicoccus vermicola]
MLAPGISQRIQFESLGLNAEFVGLAMYGLFYGALFHFASFLA